MSTICKGLLFWPHLCPQATKKSPSLISDFFLAIFKYSSIFVNMHFFIVMDRKDRCPGTFCCTWSSRGRTGRGHFLKERLASALGMPSDSTATQLLPLGKILIFLCNLSLAVKKYCFCIVFPKYFHKINHPSIWFKLIIGREAFEGFFFGFLSISV